MAVFRVDVVDLINTYLLPYLVPLLIALVTCLLATIALYIALGRADAAASVVVKGKEKPPFRAYTQSEVAKHNTSEDLWVTIKLKQYEDVRVFDLTSYVDEHPGGEAIYRYSDLDNMLFQFVGHVMHPLLLHFSSMEVRLLA